MWRDVTFPNIILHEEASVLQRVASNFRSMKAAQKYTVICGIKGHWEFSIRIAESHSSIINQADQSSLQPPNQVQNWNNKLNTN